MKSIPTPGDRATNYRTGKTGYVAQVGKGRKSDNVYIRLESDSSPFPLSDAIPGDEYSSLLSDDDITAIASWLTTLADAREYSADDREMLSMLTPAQKTQVWRNLSIQAKSRLKALAGQLDAAEARNETKEVVA